MRTRLSLHSVDAILVLRTADGSRLFAKYYAPPFPAARADDPSPSPFSRDTKAQRALEDFLANKLTRRADVDVLLFENRVVLCKVEADVAVAVVGAEDANEIRASVPWHPHPHIHTSTHPHTDRQTDGQTDYVCVCAHTHIVKVARTDLAGWLAN